MKPPVVTLRFALYGCKNRPFFFIVATNRKRPRNYGYLEQERLQNTPPLHLHVSERFKNEVGTFDPIPNTRNEKLASLNMDRIRYWLSVGARPSKPVATLLGLAGVVPPHPRSLVTAAKNREALAAGALTTDVLEGAEKDDEQQQEENTENP